MADGFLLLVESIVGGTLAGVEPTDLVETIGALLQLIKGLAVVLASLFEVTQLAVDIAAEFERGGESVDTIEVGAEGLLGFFDGCGGGVQRLVEVSSGTQRFYAVLKNANEGSGRRVHKYRD